MVVVAVMVVLVVTLVLAVLQGIDRAQSYIPVNLTAPSQIFQRNTPLVFSKFPSLNSPCLNFCLLCSILYFTLLIILLHSTLQSTPP